ncbi:protein NRT1/ PTR FAMILY 5.6-like [Lycium barbarum]|uniref:protein NRT1/ PTR FAMILY 5.6-like n=1 Tax=Lycium barbarum TaxID=112863 RepID=UPI00293E30F1|nr:protein NRT1/ PTR FAMILY 5.6-like [Lycium barbarum]
MYNRSRIFRFLVRHPIYKHEDTSPSPILNAFNVVKAAVLKRHLDYPVSPYQLFRNYSTSATEILPHIAFLRWLDKAAIVEPSPPYPVSTEQAETAGRLFEVEKVKDVKSLIRATTNAFFYEQANYMDDRLGKISHVPIVVFATIKTSTSSIISIICELLKSKGSARRRPPLCRIILGMLFSKLCCLTAWRVEVHRLHHLKVQRVEDGAEVYINLISVFWLTPQFFLVGVMDGLSSSGLQDFFETQVCKSMKGYALEFSEFATSIGKFVSVICIIIFNSWFKEDINASRLDKYYAILMVPTFLNYCICGYVSNWYDNQQLHDMDNAQKLEVT